MEINIPARSCAWMPRSVAARESGSAREVTHTSLGLAPRARRADVSPSCVGACLSRVSFDSLREPPRLSRLESRSRARATATRRGSRLHERTAASATTSQRIGPQEAGRHGMVFETASTLLQSSWVVIFVCAAFGEDKTSVSILSCGI